MKNNTMILVLILVTAYLDVASTVFPMGGRQQHPFIQGRTMQVRWDDALNATHLDLAVWDGTTSTLTMIAQRIPAGSASYVWSIPTQMRSGDRYRMMVRDSDAPLRAEFSAGYLTIGSEAQQVVASIGAVDTGEDVHVAPFPATSQMTITWQDRMINRIEIVDIHRRTALTTDVDGTADHAVIDVRSIASGMYFVKLHHTNGAQVIAPAMIGR